MLGTMCARFDAEAILIAVGITCGVTFGLTIFAFQTKYDFTTCGGMLCAMLVILMISGIVLAIMGTSK
jgi:FtsH-binding integral membrane protein